MTGVPPVGNRFAAGNKAARPRGNPLNRKVQQFRSALLRSISTQDMAEVARKLVQQAKSGDRLAISELLDRTIGRPVQFDVMTRIEALENLIESKLAALTDHRSGEAYE